MSLEKQHNATDVMIGIMRSIFEISSVHGNLKTVF